MRKTFTRLRPAEWAVLAPFAVFCFVYPFALVLLSFGLMPFGMEWMSSLLLAMLGLAAAGWLWLNFGAVGAWLSTLVFALGVLLEYIGVTTGVPFGRYAYTGVLLPELPGGVPMAMGFAWLLIVVASLFTARWLLKDRVSPLVIYLTGAALAVGLDLLLEPVAYQVKGYWRWLDGSSSYSYYGVPWSNFAAWFVAALFMCWLLSVFTMGNTPLKWGWLPVALYSMNVLLFGVVNAAHGFWIPGAIGVCLLALLWLSNRRSIQHNTKTTSM